MNRKSKIVALTSAVTFFSSAMGASVLWFAESDGPLYPALWFLLTGAALIVSLFFLYNEVDGHHADGYAEGYGKGRALAADRALKEMIDAVVKRRENGQKF